MNPNLALIDMTSRQFATVIVIALFLAALIVLVCFIAKIDHQRHRWGPPRVSRGRPMTAEAVQALATLARCRAILEATPDATDEPVDVQLGRYINERDRLRQRLASLG